MSAMSHTVVAELVAAVLKVEVARRSTVAADDAVVILESMKMEIPVLAEVAGTVTEIVVAAGDVVNDGDPLVVSPAAEATGRCIDVHAPVRPPADRDGHAVPRRTVRSISTPPPSWPAIWSTSWATTAW